MTLEYLFLNSDAKEDVKKLICEKKDSRISIKDYKMRTEGCWRVVLETVGNNADDAKILSELNSTIKDNYNPTVLTNNSADFYTRLLYPMVNGFERLLRKYLFIRAVNSDEKTRKEILGLEKMDFGQIYDFLFVDQGFKKKTMSKLSNARTKKEMLTVIKESEEKIVWDTVTENGKLKIIRDNFDNIRKIRNDVMHSHDISCEEYEDAHALYSEANKQLEIEIGISIKNETPIAVPEEFATMMESTLVDITRQAIVIGERLSEIGRMMPSQEEMAVNYAALQAYLNAAGIMLSQEEMAANYAALQAYLNAARIMSSKEEMAANFTAM